MNIGEASGIVALILSLISLGIGVFILDKFKNVFRAANSVAQIACGNAADIKLTKSLEKSVAGDVLSKYPELTMLLGQLSPETAEMVKKNPQLAVTLIQRYQPLIEKYLPMVTGQGKGNPKTEYDL